jgi:hypothetical protein
MATEVRISPTTSSLMYFLGVFLLLMGLYGVIRMAYITYRGVPYPSSGAYPSNLLFERSGSLGYGKESDCRPYPQLYYETDNKTLRQPTQEENWIQQQIAERCVEGFNEDRAKTFQYDRNLTAFLIFLGLGLIFSRKLYYLV